MRKHGRVDANQASIVKALRDVGASVQSLADVGDGCPDLLVYFRGYHMLEVKNGEKPPSKRALTPEEHRWIMEWRGPVSVVTSVDDALRAIGAIQ